jgi:glycosyltransferase involved in cell wall biosynthesis
VIIAEIIIWNQTMSLDKPQLTIVVPVYNEEQALPELIGPLLEYSKAENWRIIFVNDGSTDRSGEYLNQYKKHKFISIYHHKLNHGYGGALKTGIRNVKTQYIVTIDADGQHSPSDIKKLFRFAIQNNADMVIGSRSKQKKHTYRSLGKWIIRTFAHLLVPLPINDLNSGFKLYQSSLAQTYIKICPDSMAFSDVITLIFIKQRKLVLEYAIDVKPRQSGKSTITTLTAFETIMEILNIAVLFNPLRIFLPLSLFCLTTGLIWGTYVQLSVGRGISVGAMLAIVTGLIFFMLGLLANQISALRMENIQS